LDVEAVAGVERVELRCDMRDEALMVLEGQALELPEMELDMPLSVVHHSPAGPIVMAGEGDLVYEVLGRRFLVSSTSFFQVNTPMAAEMVQHLLDELPLKPDSTVLDVYCGVGLFSAFLAPRVARVIGIELAESAVEDFAANLDEFDNVEIYQGPAEVVLPDLQVKADVIVVDPPRAGLERAALDALVEMRAPVLAYVSCDQATLARDAKRLLRGGYRLAQITPFDLFPQTAHIESISLFVHDTT
jgi:23S rRNA (uracil1939-C5)-methyltransferase